MPGIVDSPQHPRIGFAPSIQWHTGISADQILLGNGLCKPVKTFETLRHKMRGRATVASRCVRIERKPNVLRFPVDPVDTKQNIGDGTANRNKQYCEYPDGRGSWVPFENDRVARRRQSCGDRKSADR